MLVIVQLPKRFFRYGSLHLDLPSSLFLFINFFFLSFLSCQSHFPGVKKPYTDLGAPTSFSFLALTPSYFIGPIATDSIFHWLTAVTFVCTVVLLFVVGSQLEGENCFKGLLNLYFPFFASYYYIILHSNITVVQAFEAFKSSP